MFPLLLPTKYCEKTEGILLLSRGKRVLHLGCIGTTDYSMQAKLESADKNLHAKLTACCDCVGVDLDGETVAGLRQAGIFSNIRHGDVERLGELQFPPASFDVVVAGDIIEHLSNPGRMLEGVKGLLKPQGLLILSMPNAFGLLPFLRYVTSRFREGDQHVLAFQPYVLHHFLERTGYRIVSAATCFQPESRLRHGIFFKLGIAFFKAFPRLGGTLLYTAEVVER